MTISSAGFVAHSGPPRKVDVMLDWLSDNAVEIVGVLVALTGGGFIAGHTIGIAGMRVQKRLAILSALDSSSTDPSTHVVRVLTPRKGWEDREPRRLTEENVALVRGECADFLDALGELQGNAELLAWTQRPYVDRYVSALEPYETAVRESMRWLTPFAGTWQNGIIEYDDQEDWRMVALPVWEIYRLGHAFDVGAEPGAEEPDSDALRIHTAQEELRAHLVRKLRNSLWCRVQELRPWIKVMQWKVTSLRSSDPSPGDEPGPEG